MMSKKPRNKKYNPRRVEPIAADQSLRMNKLAIWFTINQKTARVVSFKTNKVFDPDARTAHLISGYDHFWSYTLVIYCRDQQGGEYIITGEPTLPDDNGVPLSERRLNQADLAESLDVAHKKFIKESVNPLHMVNTGWIAIPYKYELNEQTICRVADTHGVWNYKSKYEQELSDNEKELSNTTQQIKALKTKSYKDFDAS